jgi:hypothetical protein
MALVTPAKAEEIIGELKTLAHLLELQVIEVTKFPTIMMRVAHGDKSVSITKQGSEFLATDKLPELETTFVGGGMFSYRLEL